MKVAVHLVSLPWAPVLQPSVALGCLKAYVDMYFHGKVKCRSYSAFVEVLVEAIGDKFLNFCDPAHSDRSAEAISQIVYFEEFKKKDFKNNHRRDFIKQIAQTEKLFSLSVANKLRTSLKNYINNHIVPNLRKDCVNIVGLSMCIQQCYFSAFTGKYLKENYPEFKFVFLYGGSSADSITVSKVFANEEVPGFLVIGEGEAKLASIIETVQGIDSWSGEAEEQIAQNTVGVLPISSRVLLYEKNKNFYKTQVDVNSLPAPDYQEYFDTLSRVCEDSGAYNELMKMVRIPLEGSRGCFGNCDFCNNDIVWDGFRSFSHEQIVSNALNYTSRFNCNNIFFVDNVCNTWVAKFADAIIAQGRSVSTCMELRAQHNETFWTKLGLSGLKMALIGTEALSPSLLQAIDKGTTVVQNILTQKYLKELEITTAANIMADHPKSTLEDVRYTKYVADHLSHLDQYTITYFALVQGSPLYSNLSYRKRRELKTGYIVPCKGNYKKLYISDFFKYPKKWLPPHIEKAWKDFAKWYDKRKKRLLVEPETLDVIECSFDMLWIRRVSGGIQKDFKYGGKYANVYEICHQGLTKDQILERLNFTESEVGEALKEFTSEKLMIDIEGVFISLALRSRDVLVSNYLEAQAK